MRPTLDDLIFRGRSLRRRRLDRDLSARSHMLSGTILDLGGERESRGAWRPPANVRRIVVNIDPQAGPDVAADIRRLPLRTGAADAVLLLEVLEHVARPMEVLQEAHRVIRPDGLLLVSVPFMFRVHRDPEDHYRFTRQGLESVLGRSGFDPIAIVPQGGLPTVVADLCFFALGDVRSRVLRACARVTVLPVLWACWAMDRTQLDDPPVTTGYLAMARRH